jgi:hypothetical protein
VTQAENLLEAPVNCEICGKSFSKRGINIHKPRTHKSIINIPDPSEKEDYDEFESFCDDLFGKLNGRLIQEMIFKKYGNKVFLSIVYEIV